MCHGWSRDGCQSIRSIDDVWCNGGTDSGSYGKDQGIVALGLSAAVLQEASSLSFLWGIMYRGTFWRLWHYFFFKIYSLYFTLSVCLCVYVYVHARACIKLFLINLQLKFLDSRMEIMHYIFYNLHIFSIYIILKEFFNKKLKYVSWQRNF